MGGAFLFGAFIGVIACAIIGAAIGPSRGWTAGSAFIVCLLLGIIGLAIVVLVKGSNPTPADIQRQQQWQDWNRWQAWQQQQQYQQWQYYQQQQHLQQGADDSRPPPAMPGPFG